MVRLKKLYEHILMQVSDSDDADVAEVPELSGCMADGRIDQEALKQCRADD